MRRAAVEARFLRTGEFGCFRADCFFFAAQGWFSNRSFFGPSACSYTVSGEVGSRPLR
jgi:hypothetical protein